MSTPTTTMTADLQSPPARLGPVPDGRLTEKQVEAMRAELWAQWSGHRDVWSISVDTRDEGPPLVIFGVGHDAQPFPASLPIVALGGFEVPLRIEVVGSIVPY
ncbi:hypothetical protein psal_cds_1207 [Pandoravirus salinus]|uniref:Uncharacterized protein n=1 Tax=Pandoravirus salinus TaxID=1349410 RepID=S4W491_9VIRU|nr:hypothetical protein psal_cds_1207 [Pandoravirus salinus]AGO85507.2 hypothetical protein psal_cds_1207 [Pandoravirus salinus]